MFDATEYKLKSYFAGAVYAAIFKVRPEFPELEVLADSTLVKVHTASEIQRMGPIEHILVNLDVNVVLYFAHANVSSVLPKRRGDALLSALAAAIMEDIHKDADASQASFVMSYSSLTSSVNITIG